MSKNENRVKSRLRSVLWDFIHRNKWQDFDDFSLRLADKLFEISKKSKVTVKELENALKSIRTNFFVANKVSKRTFCTELLLDLAKYVVDIVSEFLIPLSFVDIFPEASSSKPEQITAKMASLDVAERYIQDRLRDILRTKKASPIPDRKHDTAHEVSDIEPFVMPVKGRKPRFAVIVKGYRSIHSKTLTWEEVSHQITKTFQRTKPDYIILATAKDPADGLVTSLDEYARTIGNPHLIIFVPPRDLTALLIAYKFL